MKIIYTVSGDEVMVDDAFHHILARHRWYTIKTSKRHATYARTYYKGEHLYMHRLVMEEPAGLVIDHLDCNSMNNQRSNLEAVTAAENTRRVSLRRRAEMAFDQWKNAKVYDDA